VFAINVPLGIVFAVLVPRLVPADQPGTAEPGTAGPGTERAGFLSFRR